MKDVMIDLETLGNTNNAVVVQIGACYFNRHTGEIGEKFSVNIDADSSLREGFEVTGSTIYWWLEQEYNARSSIISGEKKMVGRAMVLFNRFLEKAECIWSHATFDYVILLNHLNKLNIKPSFSYRSARDLRTLTDLVKIDPKSYKSDGVLHNGLGDCIFQVGYTVDCINALNNHP